MSEEELKSIIENEKEWRKFIVKNIDDIKNEQKNHNDKIALIEKNVGKLETKVSIYSGGMGAFTGTIGAIFVYIGGKIRGL